VVVSVLLRGLAFVAFLGLGIAWMADHDDVLGVLWVVSFAVVALLTIWYALTDEARAGLSQVGDLVPWPSKDHRDYL
jgi:hypothetical protein